MKNIFVSLSIFLWATVLVNSALSSTVPPNTVVATIPVGVTPAGLAVTPDNNFVYVANNNNYGISGVTSFGLTGVDSVTVINANTNLPVTTIYDPSFSQPYTVTINASGTKAYVSNSDGTTITVINVATNTVVGVINGFDGPSGFAITPDQTRAYVNNYGGPEGVMSGNGTTVRVVDLATNAIVGAPIMVGTAPAGLAVTPDGAHVYVINYVDGNPDTGTISIIRTSDNTVVGTIPGLFGPFDIAITPDGLFAYVTNFGSNNFEPYGTTVSVVDLTSNAITGTINVGIQPSGVAISPDGRFVYVTNYNTLYASPTGFQNLTPGQGTVNIIDTTTNTVIPPIIAVDQSPANVAVSRDGQFAYVSNYISNTVNAIALQSFQIIDATGCNLENIFLLEKELVNKITWDATGSSLPVAYAIYRDPTLTQLAATISASQPLQFFDHNAVSGAVYTYYLVGINEAGTTSAPVAVTVNQSC